MKTVCGLLLALALYGQNASFHEDTLHGRRAFVLENDKMRVSTLPGGGFIGEIRFKSPDPKKSINPMRVPHYQAIDPYTFDPAKHDKLYGSSPDSRYLMSGYMGHFLTFPNYGPSSRAEQAFNNSGHGEALTVEWKRFKVDEQPDGVTLHYGADMPKTQYRVERAITLPADETVGYIEESVENMTLFDRAYQWVQHITFGPPFVEPGKNYVDASVAKVAPRKGRDYGEAEWSDAYRFFPPTPHSSRYTVWMADQSRPQMYFAMYNPDYPVLIGYIFNTADNPWFSDWQENQSSKAIPWDGKVIARAVDIGNSPFANGIRYSVEKGKLFDVPVYGWIQA
ncbi:MAG: DUF4432 family protein, partial [Acidobacteria bacterium]|nr:DUF4432 family protein [Acidobacteriota bacterium]